MILVLLTFGERLENHYQACFAILSYLKSAHITSVCVVTDQPKYYKYFGERVDVIEINDDIMNEWKEPFDFFWRIKMKGIEAASLKNQGSYILYVDSDTLYIHNLENIKKGLDSGKGYMHEKEGSLSTLPSKTTRKTWKSLRGETVGTAPIDSTTEMWNAGVIAIPGDKASDVIEFAIQLCDQMCATNCPRRLIEQFAFSLALKQKLNLQAAEHEIAHYWGNKPSWNKKIVDFFMQSTLYGYTVDQDIERLDPSELIKIPTVYREKNTKHKIMALLDRILKPKHIRYFKK